MHKKLFLIFLIFLISINGLIYSQNYFALDRNKDLILGGAVLSITATAYIFDKKNKALTEEEILNLNKEDLLGFDRKATTNYSVNAARWSDAALLLSISSPAILMCFSSARQDALDLGVMGAQNLFFTTATTMLVKNTTKRIRPYAYNSEVPLEKKLNKDSRQSFFSGHTSLAFASASFLSTSYSHYFPESDSKYLVWGASFGLASTVGFLRYKAGKHFPTDIIGGAIAGSLIGWGISEMHKKTEKPENGPRSLMFSIIIPI